MPRLNIGMLNAGMSATIVSRHFGYSKECRAFMETIPCHRKRCRPRPRVITAADDRNIVLQHLRNRRLTVAVTGRQYGIHPRTVRNRLRQKMLNLFVRTDVIERQGGIGAAVTCLHF